MSTILSSRRLARLVAFGAIASWAVVAVTTLAIVEVDGAARIGFAVAIPLAALASALTASAVLVRCLAPQVASLLALRLRSLEPDRTGRSNVVPITAPAGRDRPMRRN